MTTHPRWTRWLLFAAAALASCDTAIVEPEDGSFVPTSSVLPQLPIPLGSLGGTNGGARAVNSSGHIVGISETALGAYHAFLWTPQDGIRDLGAADGVQSSASGINDLGQVVGYYVGTDGSQNAFLWDLEGGMTRLWGGSPTQRGNAINNRGEIVGRDVVDGRLRGVYWSLDTGPIAIEDLPGAEVLRSARAYDATNIDDSGTIIGVLYDDQGRRGFVWNESSGLLDAGPTGAPDPLFYDINRVGDIVGYNLDWEVFLWSRRAGTVTWIGDTSTGDRYMALGLNDDGQITGRVLTAAGVGHALTWTQEQGIVLLPSLGGSYSAAWDINNSGLIVGVSDGQPVAWITAAHPQTREDCTDDRWMRYGFKNQGQCLRYVNTGQDSR